MAPLTGRATDKVWTPWQHQHELIEAAQERGWTIASFDLRAGAIVLEEAIAGGIVLRIAGFGVTAAWIRQLPEARQPGEPV